MKLEHATLLLQALLIFADKVSENIFQCKKITFDVR